MLFEYSLLLALAFTQQCAATPPAVTNNTQPAPATAPPLAKFKPCIFDFSVSPCDSFSSNITQDRIEIGGPTSGGREWKKIEPSHTDVGYASECRITNNWWIKIDTFNLYSSVKVVDDSCLRNGGNKYDVRALYLGGWECGQTANYLYKGTAYLTPIGKKGKCINMQAKGLQLIYVPYKKSATGGTVHQ